MKSLTENWVSLSGIAVFNICDDLKLCVGSIRALIIPKTNQNIGKYHVGLMKTQSRYISSAGKRD